jgi:N utilization substance protein B
MNRRKARECALQMLFQYDFTGKKADPDLFKDLLSHKISKEENRDFKEFADELVNGSIENIEEIDNAIKEAAENWKIERMSAVDRNIMRIAVYEILYSKNIPEAVTINEALEIAKKYSSLESVQFINGLLDKIARNSGKP